MGLLYTFNKQMHTQPEMNAQDAVALTANVALQLFCQPLSRPLYALVSSSRPPVKAQFRSYSLWGLPSRPTHPTSHTTQAWLHGNESAAGADAWHWKQETHPPLIQCQGLAPDK